MHLRNRDTLCSLTCNAEHLRDTGIGRGTCRLGSKFFSFFSIRAKLAGHVQKKARTLEECGPKRCRSGRKSGIGQTRDKPVAGDGGHGNTDGSALNGAAEIGQPGAGSRGGVAGGHGHKVTLRSGGNAADPKVIACDGAAGGRGKGGKKTGHGLGPDRYAPAGKSALVPVGRTVAGLGSKSHPDCTVAKAGNARNRPATGRFLKDHSDNVRFQQPPRTRPQPNSESKPSGPRSTAEPRRRSRIWLRLNPPPAPSRAASAVTIGAA